MAVYLVTYDLNKPGQNYAKLLETIKKYSWARLSESSYAISTVATADAILREIRAVIDQGDHVYVISLNQPHSGFGPQEVNNWLQGNLKSC